ncbi:hypothetical protein CFR73_08290 [Novacetimonas maltaceti]|uniref:Uncharacterized protein n=1 Tax=Novacetimonas maltaceti TaxID=1203393 RepID=A0A2S3W2E5_9PROT|nr:hypothetical protein [Novacetimonas maltaceti]POF62723.1 hypothetical protein KMAL_16610 [Novacetimonas maltaceti]PYD60216.1 hypothetical protein CFR73_08290 [Novacetimonas maltaceti]
MLAQQLTEGLIRVLERPDLRVIAGTRRISLSPDLPEPFRVTDRGDVLLGSACLGNGTHSAFYLRHALELAHLLDIAPHQPVMAALCAARTAALFHGLDVTCDAAPDGVVAVAATPAALPTWIDIMAADHLPPPDRLHDVWQAIAPCQPAPATLPDIHDVHARLGPLWAWTGPTETLMAMGGDARLSIDPTTGLNHYGCSHRPRPWAVTFASSTASSLSERGFAGAEAARLRLIAAALSDPQTDVPATLTAEIHDGIGRHFGLRGDEGIILAPSGTDCELYALALAALAPGGRAVSNILIAPEETGSGVPLAARGCHFANDTALGHMVPKGHLIAGFPDDTQVIDLPMRDARGQQIPLAQVDADCLRVARAELARGRHILLHRLDLSKTGLLAPQMETLDTLVATAPAGQVDVVVDACQTRLDPMRVRDYLDRGWMVMVTGSKFFTGPPFCGAVLLPAPVMARLSGRLPAGLAQYTHQAAWPVGQARTVLPAGHNIGLLLRWHAALAEMAALADVPRATVTQRLRTFLSAARDAITHNPDLCLLPPYAPRRRPLADAWDDAATILSFFVRAHDAGDTFRPLALAQARRLYAWLNTDLSTVIPARDADERRLAALLCHVGQPVPLAHPALDGALAGALRISAGARLVSGEPSHDGMDSRRRMERETRDVRRVVDKISLILRHWPTIAAHDPHPTYMPHHLEQG